MWKALKEYISSFHVTTFGFEQVCVERHCMPPHLSRARRQPLLCANSLHLTHSSIPHPSCYIISPPFTCFQMFPSHTHCTLYSPCFISHDIHPYFLRSPRGPGGCNSSPLDTGCNGSARDTGCNSGPPDTGCNSSPRDIGCNSSPRDIGCNSNPRDTGCTRSHRPSRPGCSGLKQ
ncbi:hypothetical protein NHX12_024117, partial [Muraenolepis orangiensis]